METRDLKPSQLNALDELNYLQLLNDAVITRIGSNTFSFSNKGQSDWICTWNNFQLDTSYANTIIARRGIIFKASSPSDCVIAPRETSSKLVICDGGDFSSLIGARCIIYYLDTWTDLWLPTDWLTAWLSWKIERDRLPAGRPAAWPRLLIHSSYLHFAQAAPRVAELGKNAVVALVLLAQRVLLYSCSAFFRLAFEWVISRFVCAQNLYLIKSEQISRLKWHFPTQNVNSN